MFSEKKAQSKLGRGNNVTTGAVVRHQKNTAGLAYMNSVDKEVDDFVMVESTQAYHVIVQLLTLIQSLAIMSSSSLIVGYAHGTSQIRG